MDELEALVTDFRNRLEAYDNAHGLSLMSFPGGACEDASILLAHHLVQNGFGPFRYMCGVRDQGTHVWLYDGTLIVDITADQFDEFNDAVFISDTSPWHAALNGIDNGEATFSIHGDDVATRYRSAYRALMAD